MVCVAATSVGVINVSGGFILAAVNAGGGAILLVVFEALLSLFVVL